MERRPGIHHARAKSVRDAAATGLPQTRTTGVLGRNILLGGAQVKGAFRVLATDASTRAGAL